MSRCPDQGVAMSRTGTLERIPFDLHRCDRDCRVAPLLAMTNFFDVIASEAKQSRWDTDSTSAKLALATADRTAAREASGMAPRPRVAEDCRSSRPGVGSQAQWRATSCRQMSRRRDKTGRRLS